MSDNHPPLHVDGILCYAFATKRFGQWRTIIYFHHPTGHFLLFPTYNILCSPIAIRHAFALHFGFFSSKVESTNHLHVRGTTALTFHIFNSQRICVLILICIP